MDQDRVTNVTYLELCKAFEYVPHDILASKLERYRFDGRTFQWIRNWPNVHIQRVAANSLMSKRRSVTCGIPQGPVLGKMLFNIFAVDMDSGTELTLNTFVYRTKLCVVVFNTGGDASRGTLTGLEMWDCVNLTKSIKAKCLDSVINS